MASLTKSNYSWLISKKDDLVWIIGSGAASLFLLLLYFFLSGVLPTVSNIRLSDAVIIGIIFFIWSFFFDSTHFFATYSRTYFDKSYLENNKTLLFSSLLIFLLGPFLLISAWALSEKQFQEIFTKAIFALIIFGSVLWGYYHIVRQHWGMLALYQKKNKENNAIQYRLDALLLAVGCLWPFVFYLNENIIEDHRLINVRSALQEGNFIDFLQILSVLLLSGFLFKRVAYLEVLGKLFSYIGCFLLLLLIWLKSDIQISVESILIYSELSLRILFIGIVIAYISYVFLNNKKINIPKLLLLASVLIVHNLVLLSVTNFLLISACLTIFHNIQYHRIVRFFNVNHYQTVDQGFSFLLTQKLFYFIVIALFFSFVVIAMRGSILLAENALIKMILITSVVNGVALHHYYLDGLIWRVSKSTTLSDSLKV
jgi:hypothetical protein